MKYKCRKCGKHTTELHKLNSIYSSTEGYCKECAAKLNNEDIELLEAIKNGEDLSRFLR